MPVKHWHQDEFRQMTEHQEFSAWLQAMELDVSDADKLFILIDSSRRIPVATVSVLSGLRLYVHHNVNVAECGA